MTYHTNIRHQETVALLGSRNLQLRVVYAHIANYTMAKDAWCGKRQKLADELEMERSVVSRKLDELITMGVVVADGDSYRAVNTEERAESTEQRAEDTAKRAVSTSPTPPIIKNNNMERNENIARAQIRTAQVPTPDSFEELLKAYTLRVGEIKLADSTRDECLRMWKSEKYPEWKRKMLIAKVQSGEWMKPRLDWLIGDFDPKPYDYNHHELPKDVALVSAKFGSSYGIFSAEEAEEFGMENVKPFNYND